MMPPMYPAPSCWWNQRTLMRHARIFHRDIEGEPVLELIGDTGQVDKIARALSGFRESEDALVLAISDVHSGNEAEARLIVRMILATIIGDPDRAKIPDASDTAPGKPTP